jgi:hypothetical protein
MIGSGQPLVFNFGAANFAAIASQPVQWPGGVGVWKVGGGSIGTSAALQGQDDAGNWFNLDSTNLVLTAVGAKQFNWPAGPLRVQYVGTPTTPASSVTPTN